MRSRGRPPRSSVMHLPLSLLLLLLALALAGGGGDGEGERKQVCYAFLGCFSLGPPWCSDSRLIPPPDTPESIATTFYLFTRNYKERSRPVQLRPKVSFLGKDFNASRPIVFITHGLASNSRAQWMLDMKDAFLQKMDANVYLTDWGPGAANVLKYNQAVANTRIVAAEMRRFILHLMKNYDMSPEKIHLVGHSLGAQISAYTGKKVKNIYRITALDPAQPAFEGHDRRVRLDVRDASFVEVVHTDAKPTVPLFGLGMITDHGHVDYYINGGFFQPGCAIPMPFPEINSIMQFFELPISLISKLAACAHTRAVEVYIESLRATNCTFWGHPATFIDTFLEAVNAGYSTEFVPPYYAKCSADSCSPLNLDNRRYPARGKFVVPTGSGSPFCVPEPEVDNSMRAILASWEDKSYKIGATIRTVIGRGVEKVGRTIGRKFGSVMKYVPGMSWILRG